MSKPYSIGLTLLILLSAASRAVEHVNLGMKIATNHEDRRGTSTRSVPGWSGSPVN